MTSCHMITDGGDRRDVVPDSAFTVFRARVNAHLARAPTALYLVLARFRSARSHTLFIR